jgi:molybdate transport system substrate-binding protein
MNPTKRSLSILAACAFSLLASAALAQETGMLIYCGITMVRPITELARSFEQREKVSIRIAQGGSEDLYQSAKKAQQGDIYFPGEPSYLDKHKAEGLLGDFKLVGYNQLAIFVQEGNPKKVKPELSELLRQDLTLVVGNAESGSVGLETKQVLDRFKMYPAVVKKAAFMMPDSRSLALSFKRGDADVALSWRATAFFPDNAPFMDAIALDPKIAEPQALLLIQLTFSKSPTLARKFIDYVASSEGQAVFRKFGFLDSSGKG